ncbi:GIY-YIG nuclease family protein [Sinorhizobium medicae]|uniref:GIY-YIG nuclease family protein n=1 Tax=Sinorhizobium medicae TaxID=110321 RepID=UPI000FDC582B|nr:GIY-YIG nuclease family protein [Sinorhizobium medicae]RVP48141.1 GIY-YIG nuclease family protein [Sinorhizobium medicae]RVP75428.1 GIY-YIG nuclease family protein [Sinorhizobium medicae]UWU06598.1 GIY-YIG nuclease family protein [Sinorhizobium medicae]
MAEGYREFEFDLPTALLNSLVNVFATMESASLTPEHTAHVADEQGVYQLLLDGQVVYVGKTDADSGLRGRLRKHSWTIQHRLNLKPSDVQFKAARVFVFTAMDLEKLLIRYYESTSGDVWWNSSGFGSNDPGRNRDRTELKEKGFDAQYPIDLDYPVVIATDGGVPATRVLEALRAQLPYTLRAQGKSKGSRKAHAELEAAMVPTFVVKPATTRQVILSVLSVLPPGWQATMLPGRIILYKENEHYNAGVVIGRS